MSAVGKAGEDTVHVHMCHLFSKRKLSRKTGHVEDTPNVLEVKKNWTRSILTTRYWRENFDLDIGSLQKELVSPSSAVS